MEQGTFLDLESWSRRTQYLFFKEFEQPFFNICAEIDVSAVRAWCREHKQPFAMACWYLCQCGINAVAPFRYRLRGDKVWVHERVSISTTVLEGDETLRFCYFPYEESFGDFVVSARAVMADSAGGDIGDQPDTDSVIHGSVLPWVRFTSVSHARQPSSGDSVPKIMFGRYAEEGERVMMPMSVEVHHALMDGLHVSRLFAWMEEAMASPEVWLSAK